MYPIPLTLSLVTTFQLAGGGPATGAGAPDQPRAVEAPIFAQAWGDFDADGLDDVLVLPSSQSARLLRNLGTGDFEDVTARSGLDDSAANRMAEWADFDIDGALDLLLVTATGGIELYRGDGTGFLEEVSDPFGMGELGVVVDARWGDYDGDGWFDVLTTLEDGRPVLLHAQGGAYFERVEPVGVPQIVDATDFVQSRGDVAQPANDEAPEPGPVPVRSGDRSRAVVEVAAAGADTPNAPSATGSTTNPIPAGPDAATSVPLCAASLKDQATGTCVTASSVPSIGKLYPLSSSLNVDSLGRVGINTTSPAYQLHVSGNALTGDLTVAGGNGPNPMLIHSFSIDGTHLQLTNSSSTWEVINTGINDSVGEGALQFSNDLLSTPALTIRQDKRVGINNTSPTAMVDVISSTNDVPAVQATHSQPNSAALVAVNAAGGSASTGVRGEASGYGVRGIGTGPQGRGVYGSASQSSGYAGYFDGLVRLEGGFDVAPSSGGFLISGDPSSQNLAFDDNEIMARNAGFASTLFLNNEGGLVQMGGNSAVGGSSAIGGTLDVAGDATLSGSLGVSGLAVLDGGIDVVGQGHFNNDVSVGGELNVTGWTRTLALEITGGADIAEPFEISGDARPGHVVAIDPNRVGELRIARQAYDTTVAGIVSGAGGVDAGLILQQEASVASGSQPVALTGRVWCWADAAVGGPIAAGDLLTTSDTPGHAMRVGDPGRAQGAVLGKAMSALDSGRGLVFVLVGLQ